MARRKPTAPTESLFAEPEGLKPLAERMLFRDQLGNTTEIDFSNWRRNPKIDAAQFKFTPPKGVDVIGDMDPGAEIHPIRD